MAGQRCSALRRGECADATSHQTQPYEASAAPRVVHLWLSASFRKGGRTEKEVRLAACLDDLGRAVGWFATGGRPPAGEGGGRAGHGGYLGRSGERHYRQRRQSPKVEATRHHWHCQLHHQRARRIRNRLHQGGIKQHFQGVCAPDGRRHRFGNPTFVCRRHPEDLHRQDVCGQLGRRKPHPGPEWAQHHRHRPAVRRLHQLRHWRDQPTATGRSLRKAQHHFPDVWGGVDPCGQ
jgi:hypothetical protein